MCSEKSKINKKHKLVTSQKFKESKNCATDPIHNFWKKGLSANSSLPNFTDDLNAHKNLNVSNLSANSSLPNFADDLNVRKNLNVSKL